MSDKVLSRRFSVYGALTEKIVGAIKDAKGTYRMPWHSSAPNDLPVNALTERVYHGVNILSLWIDRMRKGFATNYWASYKQWQTLGAQVRYDERGTLVFYYKKIEPTELEREAGELPRFVGKAYWIFNAAQVDNWLPPDPESVSNTSIDTSVSTFVEATKARVLCGYSRACYRTDFDAIEMPPAAWFFDTPTSTAAQAYHAVLFHELTHWTGPSHRCDREFGKRYGDRAYAFEELVAELGAAFLCSIFRIANEPRQDHAAYVAEWLELLSNDTHVIFMAATKAQEAIEYLAALTEYALSLAGDALPECEQPASQVA